MILKLLIFFSLYLDEPVLVQSTPTRKQLQEYRENEESKSKLETTQLGDVMNVENKSKLKTPWLLLHASMCCASPFEHRIYSTPHLGKRLKMFNFCSNVR